MIKVSDYIANFIKALGVKNIFAIQGGASAHLIDSIAKCEGINYICNQHEQASAMAADGYARITRNIGVAIATSGPGATNLLTGCCSAYYDSIPVLFITGQVASFRLKKDLGIRQLGFQETETVKIFEPVVKYGVLLNKPEDIRYELEKAVHIAMEGRKGPVLIDIPDDFQRAFVDEKLLKPYLSSTANNNKSNLGKDIDFIVHQLKDSKRPLIIGGRGIHLANAENEFQRIADKLQIPFVLTWGSNDLIAEENELKVGTFGINGTRAGNFAIQKSDLILVLGSRLDTHAAGTPLKSFAKNAKKIIIDIDNSELNKYEALDFNTDLLIHMDIKKFLENFLLHLDKTKLSLKVNAWKEEVKNWRTKYPVCPELYYTEEALNPYVFVKNLSSHLEEDNIIFCDTGCSLVWMNQAFEFKKGQRLMSSFNNTPMGYSLPASIGAAFAAKKRIFCVTGDGGLQMNIQELATVVQHNLNITILLFENRGYGMIQRTQDMWFQSNYEGSDINHGLAFPNFELLFKNYGFETVTIEKNQDIADRLQQILSKNGPVCGIIKVPIEAPMYPQLKFGHELEDLEPLLDSEILKKEMEII